MWSVHGATQEKKEKAKLSFNFSGETVTLYRSLMTQKRIDSSGVLCCTLDTVGLQPVVFLESLLFAWYFSALFPHLVTFSPAANPALKTLPATPVGLFAHSTPVSRSVIQ